MNYNSVMKFESTETRHKIGLVSQALASERGETLSRCESKIKTYRERVG